MSVQAQHSDVRVLRMSDYYEKRNLSPDFISFPKQELDSVLKTPEYQNIQEPVQTYIQKLRDLEVPEYKVSLVGHALYVHLTKLKELGRTEYAQFLLNTRLNPMETESPNNEKITLIEEWEHGHLERNRVVVEGLAQRINKHTTGPGVLHVAKGPMFAAKTEQLIGVTELIDEDIEIFPFIAKLVDEKTIHSRIRNRNENGEITYDSRDIVAHQVMGADFVEKLEDLRMKFNAKHFGEKMPVILLDEISLLTFAPEDCNAVAAKILELHREGFHFVISGLSSNYKAGDFPMMKALEEALAKEMEGNPFAPISVEDYEAYYTVIMDNGTYMPCENGTHTARICNALDFIDLLLPVDVPREERGADGNLLVRYEPQPADAHIFEILKRYDPELYSLLCNAGETKPPKDPKTPIVMNHHLYAKLAA
jgi:thymidine kinase